MSLLEDVRELLADRPDVREQSSIGGSRTFTVRGNLCCGVGKWGVLVRVGPEAYAAALREPHVTPLQMGKRPPLEGYVVVQPEALADDGALADWIARGVRYVLTLAPKATPAAPTRARRRQG